jgi:hypothetical protein
MNVSVRGYVLPTIIPKGLHLFDDVLCLKMMSHAVNKKAFSYGSKSVEDEKTRFLNHFNLSIKSGDDISI